MIARPLRPLIRRGLASATQPRWARVLASDPIDPICREVLESKGHTLDEKPGLAKEDLLATIPEYDGLVVRSGTQVDEDVLEAGVKLQLVGRAGTGVDNINIPAATKRGVLVMNTPGGNTVSTAELAITHILALSRNIPVAVNKLKDGTWDRKSFTGTELTGKVLGVVGLGRIGREVARCCQAFGMQVVGYDPLLSSQAARSAGIEPVELDDLFASADFISLHTPLTNDTRDLICAATLAKCKKGVRIVNCARGGIVHEGDLLDALESGQVGGASIDVYSSEPPLEDVQPLTQHPRVIATPHLGASTKDAQLRVARDIAAQMGDVFNGGDFVGVVNAPNMGAAKRSGLEGYVKLAEKIGSLQAQLLGSGKVRSLRVTAAGVELGKAIMSEPLKAAALKGVLSALLEEDVNYVNVSNLAEEIGLAVSVSTESDRPSNLFMNQLTVELEIEGVLNGRRSVKGTVFADGGLRITEIDGFAVDFVPSGRVLIFNNTDKPGVLRSVSEVLANEGVNIASFALGRNDRGSKALSLLSLDDDVSEAAMEKLQSLPEIFNVNTADLVQMEEHEVRLDRKASDAAQHHLLPDSRPNVRPQSPHFSSGPCKKRPGYDLSKIATEALGRSHRAKIGKAKLKLAIEETKRILQLPEDYLVGIVPASDTGAYEMAMWNLLGERPVDMCHWESFGKGWFQDAANHLKLGEEHGGMGVRSFDAAYGELPDLASTNPDHDICFTWNGTTAGVRVPNGDWISSDRTGLTLNDATSAAFAMDIAWDKCDVTTYSWQKVLGGEGAHGMLILSPRAVERLETYTPENRPLPKIFRLAKKGELIKGIFDGATINTPSMLCVEDYLDALAWADAEGGVSGLIRKSEANLKAVESFVEGRDWIDFLAKDKKIRSNTSVGLELPQLDGAQVKELVALLEGEKVAYDIGAYRDAPAGLRIWCGATVEQEDVEALMHWIEWAHDTISGRHA